MSQYPIITVFKNFPPKTVSRICQIHLDFPVVLGDGRGNVGLGEEDVPDGDAACRDVSDQDSMSLRFEIIVIDWLIFDLYTT